jgi:hypothetical protein
MYPRTLYGYEGNRYVSFCVPNGGILELCCTPSVFREHPDMLAELRTYLTEIGVELVEIVPNSHRH